MREWRQILRLSWKLLWVRDDFLLFPLFVWVPLLLGYLTWYIGTIMAVWNGLYPAAPPKVGWVACLLVGAELAISTQLASGPALIPKGFRLLLASPWSRSQLLLCLVVVPAVRTFVWLLAPLLAVLWLYGDGASYRWVFASWLLGVGVGSIWFSCLLWRNSLDLSTWNHPEWLMAPGCAIAGAIWSFPFFHHLVTTGDETIPPLPGAGTMAVFFVLSSIAAGVIQKIPYPDRLRQLNLLRDKPSTYLTAADLQTKVPRRSRWIQHWSEMWAGVVFLIVIGSGFIGWSNFIILMSTYFTIQDIDFVGGPFFILGGMAPMVPAVLILFFISRAGLRAFHTVAFWQTYAVRPRYVYFSVMAGASVLFLLMIAPALYFSSERTGLAIFFSLMLGIGLVYAAYCASPLRAHQFGETLFEEPRLFVYMVFAVIALLVSAGLLADHRWIYTSGTLIAAAFLLEAWVLKRMIEEG